MNLHDTYLKLPKDVTGARTKNRFKQELLWGISKIYDLYLLSEDDFFVIFDYVCDIEVGQNNMMDFYQIKTKDTGEGFRLKELIHKKGKHSYLSLLHSLRVNNSIKSANFVTNTILKCKNKDVQRKEKIEFSELNKDEKDLFLKHLKEYDPKISSLDNLYFLRSDFAIINPDTILLGKTVEFLESAIDTKLSDPKLIYNYIKNIVEERATYELHTNTLEDTIIKKGITRAEIDKILMSLKENKDEENREDIIKKIDSLIPEIAYSEILSLKIALSKVFKYDINSNLIQTLLKEIVNEILTTNQIKNFTLNEMLDFITDVINWKNIKDIAEKKCIILMAIVMLEKNQVKI